MNLPYLAAELDAHAKELEDDPQDGHPEYLRGAIVAWRAAAEFVRDRNLRPYIFDVFSSTGSAAITDTRTGEDVLHVNICEKDGESNMDDPRVQPLYDVIANAVNNFYPSRSGKKVEA
jgi:hypothetical protein